MHVIPCREHESIDVRIVRMYAYVLKRYLKIRAKFKIMFSAEPCRRAPYSADLRWRIVWRRIGMQQSYRDIAQSLNVSTGTVFNIVKIFEETGDVDFKHREYSG